MAKIFITGSSDGLGFLAAKQLISMKHRVVLHARNSDKANEVIKKLPNAEAVLIGDLSSLEETKHLAHQANNLGAFDAIIHNAGIYNATHDALCHSGLAGKRKRERSPL